MSRTKLSQAAKEFNISIQTVVEELKKKGINIDASNLNARLDDAAIAILEGAFKSDKDNIKKIRHDNPKPKTAAPATPPAETEITTNVPSVTGPKVIGHIELDKKGNPIASKPAAEKPVEATVKTPQPKQEEKKPAAEVKPAPKEPVAEPKPETPKAETPKAEAKPEQAPQPVPAQPEQPKVPATDATTKEPKAPSTPQSQPKQQPANQQGKDNSKIGGNQGTKDEHNKVKQNNNSQPDQRAAKASQTESRDNKAQAEVKTEATATVEAEATISKVPSLSGPKVVGHIDLSSLNQSTRPKKKSKEERRNERIAKDRAAQGGNANAQAGNGDRKKRRRISGKEKVDIEKTLQNGDNNGRQGDNNRGGKDRGGNKERGNDRGRGKERNKRPLHTEVNEEDVQKQVRETLARLTSKDKGQKKGAKWRKEKREAFASRAHEAAEEAAAESKVLKLTEFVTANDLAVMMDVPINNVIATCMNLGVMVSINQRLDAETINIVAEEFGFKTEYVSAEVVEAIHQDEDTEEELVTRPPIVTVMGHVDHGKTSLLDYIRNANVIAGEAGGITQHIGAYNVALQDGRHITFLDTPGHEAFTAMRARGAKVTDLCIIIVAADDNVMPQTVEAINHASAAGVPIVFAINKIDKPAANPDKIKEELAQMNYLVEDWGGKYQSQDISAKKGIGVEELMEKVLLEAEMLDLKANPNRRATGSIIESSLDKGRGYVATVLVQNGTLRVGDTILAGTHFGKVKAMFNERNQRITEAGPAEPTLILGLNGAPTAGDTFNVMETEQEAREIATKREQLQRELGLRTSKRTTLEEIGRRRAIGNFHELNIIVKGDVDGSIEALSDSLIKLSTEEVKVNVLHKAVGAISESDVTLAAASDAIIIGFQVRPSLAARRAAERDGVEIRLYSVIYQAIEEVKDAMEGMLAPEIKEEIIGTAEVLQTFHISKVGTIAGAIVREGKLKRGCKVRLIRDGIVRYTGELGSLKRMKDDVKEVTSGYDCGLSIAGYNDIQEHDIIEGYEEVEIKKSL
ncbi:MAG: translation initiation factor IF-2 [Duncaniella sp.]|nr:translation initiation factor IF-2 [Muribaculum sp.]MCM1255243.1 translation initiation factor IF-2 [Duncaniella sp.]